MADQLVSHGGALAERLEGEEVINRERRRTAARDIDRRLEARKAEVLRNAVFVSHVR
ncbi:MAG: hypothetical protein OEW91_13620 [Acidimicrobiia bacterium]|nr:hypothetical protein [Acidimicrobiia bacterium]